MIFAKKSILVAEDEDELRKMITEALESRSLNVIEADTATMAIRKLKNQKFDCVITDIKLGHETGEDIIHYTLDPKSKDNHNVPILVISGFLDKDLVSRVAKNIRGAFVKPFEPKALKETVHKIVGISK